jgi:hypothetical protein
MLKKKHNFYRIFLARAPIRLAEIEKNGFFCASRGADLAI